MRVRCHIVVIEDIERDPVGKNMDLAAVPRVGEGISNFGVVVEVDHHPVEVDDSYTPTISVYVAREAKNAHRT